MFNLLKLRMLIQILIDCCWLLTTRQMCWTGSWTTDSRELSCLRRSISSIWNLWITTVCLRKNRKTSSNKWLRMQRVEKKARNKLPLEDRTQLRCMAQQISIILQTEMPRFCRQRERERLKRSWTCSEITRMRTWRESSTWACFPTQCSSHWSSCQ